MVRLSNSVQIKPILLVFDEEEYLLKVYSESVFSACRHAVRFVPDDLVAKNPSSVTHLDGKARGDLAKAFFCFLPVLACESNS
jgi:hypothetical protein